MSTTILERAKEFDDMIDRNRPESILAALKYVFPTGFNDIEKCFLHLASHGCVRGIKDKSFDGTLSKITWPKQVYFPDILAYVLQLDKYPETEDDPKADSIFNSLKNLVAWRYSRTVYNINATLTLELGATDFDIKLPCAHLLKLPEFCQYFHYEKPCMLHHEQDGLGMVLFGFWATVEHNYDEDCPALVITALHKTKKAFEKEQEEGLSPSSACSTIHLALDSPEKSIKEFIFEAISGICDEGDFRIEHNDQGEDKCKFVANDEAKAANYDVREAYALFSHYGGLLEPLLRMIVPVLMYVCSKEPDLAPAIEGNYPKNPTPKKTKKGMRIFPADKNRIIHVGRMVEKVILETREQAEVEAFRCTGERKQICAHIRKAHWRKQWIGKRGKAKQELRWIPPAFINTI